MASRVLLADDHALMRKGLRLLIEQEADLQVVGEAEDGETAIQQTARLAPDIVIMDISMPGLNGIEATEQILATHPETRILALSIHGEKEFVDDMLAAGTSGYLLKESAPEELIAAIRKVLNGEVYLSSAITGVVVSGYRAYLSGEHPSGISKIERIVGPLLKTKFYPPQLTADLIRRPRLLEQLDRNREKPITLISAPPGYGKTVLVNQWLTSGENPSVWLSLDDSDNQLTVFLSYLLAAVSNRFPDLEWETLTLLAAHRIPPTPLLARTVASDLDQIEEPFILVLDDLQHIRQYEIHELLEKLLQHPPRNLHLVLVGRHDPALNIASLRARGKVSEIRYLDLCFTSEEAARLLQRLSNRIVDPEVAAEWSEATEGWVTALRLAALSLRHRGEKDDLRVHLGGDSRYLQDYLLAEVLAHLPGSYQNCLVKIAFLERFCGPLVEAVCQIGETPELQHLTGEAFMDWLEGENLFLIPLDDTRQWFRFHHLFRDHLLAILQREAGADEINALRRRAGSWFAENELLIEALKYALDAGDTRGAIALLDEQRHELENGERWIHLTRLLALFPDEVVGNDPILTITKARLPENYGAKEMRLHARARQLAADLPSDSPSARAINGEIACFDARLAAVFGPQAVAISRASDALDLLPENAQWFRGSAFALKAVGLQMSGDYERSIRLIEEIAGDPDLPAHFRARLFVGQSYSSFFEGALEAARRSADKCLEICIANQLWHSISDAYYVSGMSHYLRNETDRAESRLSALVRDRALLLPDYVAHGVCALARIYLAQQRPERASEAFGLVVSHVEEVGNSFSLEVLRAFEVELALSQGELAEARQLSRALDLQFSHPIWYHYLVRLTPIKLLLAERTDESLKKALGALEEWEERVRALRRKTHAVDVLALQALVHDAQGNQRAANEKAIAALRWAQPGGLIRNFVDLGPPMADLLRRLERSEGSRATSQAASSIAAHIATILSAFPEEAGTDAGPWAEYGQGYVDPLTARELDTLRYLATDLSPKQIAERMFVSVATIRTHTKNIYGKLDVHSRFEAVQRARELDLL